ncbi:MAG: hypothetical protein ACYDER_19210 [Ktedonobacteraceae bacterium]
MTAPTADVSADVPVADTSAVGAVNRPLHGWILILPDGKKHEECYGTATT